VPDDAHWSRRGGRARVSVKIVIALETPACCFKSRGDSRKATPAPNTGTKLNTSHGTRGRAIGEPRNRGSREGEGPPFFFFERGQLFLQGGAKTA
jgi:hypothetical protein